jgi:leucyl aminopeptidase
MATHSPTKLIPADFSPLPALAWFDALTVRAVEALSDGLDAVGVTLSVEALSAEGDVPAVLGLGRDALAAAGFSGKAGETLVIPQATGPLLVAVGTGPVAELSSDVLRDVAASFARATAKKTRIGLQVGDAGEVPADAAGQALAEGATLARYRYRVLKAEYAEPLLESLELLVEGADAAAVAEGVRIAGPLVRATLIARDLANTPPGHLTATNMGEIAEQLGNRFGFDVEVFDRQALIELECGGLLGVNSGSAEEPRLVVLNYEGGGDRKLAMVGKGITYDSGGISLKPSDPMHLLMKMDMSGAAAILGAFTALRELGATASVSAWLMCTDNMPSGSAYKLGDVLTAHGGTTVEVKNTDAEGRLVLMDGLVLATEWDADAIVDIATLTGAALVALGPATAALFGNDAAFVDRVRDAAGATAESLWQLPLEKRYRKNLDSAIADISNVGGPYAGATTAALFLNEFVGETPWVHLDIAGTMQSATDDGWRPAGATGFGARLLAQLARGF